MKFIQFFFYFFVRYLFSRHKQKTNTPNRIDICLQQYETVWGQSEAQKLLEMKSVHISSVQFDSTLLEIIRWVYDVRLENMRTSQWWFEKIFATATTSFCNQQRPSTEIQHVFNILIFLFLLSSSRYHHTNVAILYFALFFICCGSYRGENIRIRTNFQSKSINCVNVMAKETNWKRNPTAIQDWRMNLLKWKEF